MSGIMQYLAFSDWLLSLYQDFFCLAVTQVENTLLSHLFYVHGCVYCITEKGEAVLEMMEQKWQSRNEEGSPSSGLIFNDCAKLRAQTQLLQRT